MNSAKPNGQKVLVLGVGNTLQSDDGVGIHVADSLRPLAAKHPEISIIDGGTLGLSLLPQIESAVALIVVDAGEIDAAPGEIRIFRNQEMDQQLAGRKTTVHELAVADLLAAAALSGNRPRTCILVAIQPASTDWGLTPTAAVRESMPQARALVEELVRGLLQ